MPFLTNSTLLIFIKIWSYNGVLMPHQICLIYAVQLYQKNDNLTYIVTSEIINSEQVPTGESNIPIWHSCYIFHYLSREIILNMLINTFNWQYLEFYFNTSKVVIAHFIVANVEQMKYFICLISLVIDWWSGEYNEQEYCYENCWHVYEYNFQRDIHRYEDCDVQ